MWKHLFRVCVQAGLRICFLCFLSYCLVTGMSICDILNIVEFTFTRKNINIFNALIQKHIQYFIYHNRKLKSITFEIHQKFYIFTWFNSLFTIFSVVGIKPLPRIKSVENKNNHDFYFYFFVLVEMSTNIRNHPYTQSILRFSFLNKPLLSNINKLA